MPHTEKSQFGFDVLGCIYMPLGNCFRFEDVGFIKQIHIKIKHQVILYPIYLNSNVKKNPFEQASLLFTSENSVYEWKEMFVFFKNRSQG